MQSRGLHCLFVWFRRVALSLLQSESTNVDAWRGEVFLLFMNLLFLTQYLLPSHAH